MMMMVEEWEVVRLRVKTLSFSLGWITESKKWMNSACSSHRVIDF